jgi:Mg2+-importing ATPase
MASVPPRELRPPGFAEASAMTAEAVLSALESGREGLSEAEARRRVGLYGPNEMTARRRSALARFASQFFTPMATLLVVAAAVSMMLGERADALTIAVVLLINATISFVQEARSKKALEKLASHLTPRARVRREGRVRVVERRALAPGDVVLLEPGDVVPADLRLLSVRHLQVDESTLTGESVVVGKAAEPLLHPARGALDAAGCAFMLSRVVSGSAEGAVIATREATVMGRTVVMAEETVRVSAFEKNLAALSGFLLKSVLLILAVIFLANVFLKGEREVVPQLLFAIAMAVSVIPEALPAISAITLSSGALRLAAKHVVVRRLSAIEDLGHIETLCTDKTGTVTQGIMKVVKVVSRDSDACLAYALAATADEELRETGPSRSFGAAVWARSDAAVRRRHAALKRELFVPFDPATRSTSAVLSEDGGRTLVVMGAPENVLARCEGEGLTAAMTEMAKAGREGDRVLAVAVKRLADGAADVEKERSLRLSGWIAFADPLKPTARQAVHDAALLQVEVKILTGDSPEVAAAAGRALGVLSPDETAVTGAALEDMDAAAFAETVRRARVFARVTPEQKVRIIEELQHSRMVGFLGEGINDAPALKLADVAMAVDGASDVARESADIVLLRKDLHVIVEGIREGRAIFANVVKYVRYTLIGNFGNFLAIAGISLLIDYLPMLPVQILLTNLLTDLPLAAVATDRVGREETSKPRRFNIRELAFAAVFLGLVSSTFDFIFFALFRPYGAPYVQTGWFVCSILTELALIWSIRAAGPFWRAVRPSAWLAGLTIAAAALTIALPFTAFGREAFRFVPLDGRMLAAIFAIAAAYFAVTEAVKLAYARRLSNGHAAPV